MQELNEAKSKKETPSSYTGASVVFKIGPVFRETAIKHSLNNPFIRDAIEKFKKSKTENPLAPYGAKDYKIGNNFGNVIPGMMHAGLNNDVSIFYTLSGSNPRTIHLHGIFSHDEAGIGQPANINKQKSVVKRMDNQKFEP